MFFYAYLLKSETGGRYYIGFTHNLKQRLEKYNGRKSYWTKRYALWKLVYFEGYKAKEDALRREKQLKRFAKGFAQLKGRLRETIKL